jgi:hypothetical protein
MDEHIRNRVYQLLAARYFPTAFQIFGRTPVKERIRRWDGSPGRMGNEKQIGRKNGFGRPWTRPPHPSISNSFQTSKNACEILFMLCKPCLLTLHFPLEISWRFWSLSTFCSSWFSFCINSGSTTGSVSTCSSPTSASAGGTG